MTKAELRKEFLSKRTSLSETAVAQLSFRIYEQFFAQTDLSFIRVLHSFLPLEKNHEPDTWLIIDRIRREFPHIRIALPKVNQSTETIENIFFEGLHQLEKNSWGIPEPRHGVPVESHRIDMVLIPLLAFDVNGQRVGYGKGFYDRFLATCRTDCLRVGLSLFDPVDQIDDLNVYDIPLNRCITPSYVYSFENFS